MKPLSARGGRAVGSGTTGGKTPGTFPAPDQAQIARILARMAVRRYLWCKESAKNERRPSTAN